MDKTTRKKLVDRLDGLDLNERQKLHKRATRLLKANQKQGGRDRTPSPRNWEEDSGPKQRRMKSSSGNVKEMMLQLLEEEPADLETEFDGELEGLQAESGAEQHRGTVVAVFPKSCKVAIEGDVLDCLLPPTLVHLQQTDLAVGDEVRIVERGEDVWMVQGVVPRRTQLSRPDPGNANIERVIVTNVDAVVLVVSVRTPPLRPRLIDRYLIAITRGGAQPILCVNKLDLLDSAEERAEELEKLRAYRELGIPVVECSAARMDGTQQLLQLLEGKTCAFVGHSGVGKSSLLNALAPGLALKTNTLRESDGKGRHTTTGSTLYHLPDGVRIIDTPGIRGFGLWKMSTEELHQHFPEFEESAQNCRFSNCTHRHEPDCGVRTALEEGKLNEARFDAYLRIVNSLED